VSFASSVPGPIFPLFVESILGPKAKVATVTGLLLAVGGMVAGLSSLLVGRVGDRVGHGRMLVGCTAMSGVLSGVLAWADSLRQLFALRVGFGFAAGGTGPSMNALIARTVPNTSYGRAYGLTASASSLGWALGPMVGGALASGYGLRLPFVATGVLLVAVSTVAGLWLIPALSRHRED
jgi:DHA1 family multidrug resistance protein-like MFS transporter